ncbi:MAG: hypothetical protein AB1640_25760 [bacterium]
MTRPAQHKVTLAGAFLSVLVLCGLGSPAHSLAAQETAITGTILPPRDLGSPNTYTLQYEGREYPFRIDEIRMPVRGAGEQPASGILSQVGPNDITLVGREEEIKKLEPCEGARIWGRLYTSSRQLFVASVDRAPESDSPQLCP